jgi:hypothetical protein
VGDWFAAAPKVDQTRRAAATPPLPTRPRERSSPVTTVVPLATPATVWDRPSRIRRSSALEVGPIDHPAEREADRFADAVVHGETARITRVRRSTVIRRVPAAFTGERARLARDPRTKPNAFTSFFGLDPWGKVVDAVDTYAATDEGAVAERQRKMDALVRVVTTWKQDHAKKVTARKNDADDDARFAEVSAGGNLGGKIAAERAELATAGGTLTVPSGTATLADPGLTKKHDAKGKLNKDVVPSYDGKLTKSSGLNVPSGTTCDILADYPADGSMLVVAKSPEQGTLVAWVPRDAVDVTDVARVESAVPSGVVPPSPTPAPEKESVLTAMVYRDLPDQTALFPHPPTTEDVHQGGLGDCYLHAALLSIVARDPQYIVSMMKDDGTTVTVRFYDVTPGVPKRFTPKFARVKKSDVLSGYTFKASGVVTGGRFYETYARGALWVKMVEKAYAAAGMSGLGAALTGAPSYGEIAGGFTATAMEHLLGQEADLSVEAVQTGTGVNAALLPPGVLRLPWSSAERDAHQLAKAGEDKAQAYAGLVTFDIFHDVGKVDAWMDFAANVDIEAKVRTHVSKGTDYRKGEIRLDDFVAVFHDEGLDGTMAKAVTDWLEAKRLYPGKRGTGKYTANQLALFERIRTLLQSGGIAAVGSKSEVGRTVGGTGLSGGESKTKGIAGGHAYAVLGFTPDKDPSALQPGELVFIRLRNPWGNYGRQYEPRQGDKLKVKKAAPTGDTAKDTAATEQIHEATKGGEFDIELSDLTKRFAWLDFSGPMR